MPCETFQLSQKVGHGKKDGYLVTSCESSRWQDPSGADKVPSMEIGIPQNNMWTTGKERQSKGHLRSISPGKWDVFVSKMGLVSPYRDEAISKENY